MNKHFSDDEIAGINKAFRDNRIKKEQEEIDSSITKAQKDFAEKIKNNEKVRI